MTTKQTEDQHKAFIGDKDLVVFKAKDKNTGRLTVNGKPMHKTSRPLMVGDIYDPETGRIVKPLNPWAFV